jgi:uncharacterized damage-inducible protein DinB
MEAILKPFHKVLRLNTVLLLNCLTGLSEADAARRLTPQINNVSFIVAHLAGARYFLAELLGHPIVDPLDAKLGDVRSIEGVESLPKLGELREIWLAVLDHIDSCFRMATAQELSAPSSHPFPFTDTSVLGGVSFLMQHESYHVGQVALLRKSLGHPAMAYERSDGGAETESDV